MTTSDHAYFLRRATYDRRSYFPLMEVGEEEQAQ
jgi:hypothetical protein